MISARTFAGALLATLTLPVAAQEATSWTSWRGPNQDGTSEQTGLPDAIDVEGDELLWTHDLRGRSTPAVARGRVWAWGYRGEGPELEEVLACLDERDGSLIWEHSFPDFLSDVVYNRYSIGAPTVDPANGDVYVMTAAGLLSRFDLDGNLRWQQTLMADYGRMTFPNGRTGAPLLAEDKVIVHFISTSWGPQAPARDRFFAFDKVTGRVVWATTPGTPPKDNSFSFPVLVERGGRLLLVATTGCGNIVCIDARTGETVWRHQVSIGGLNSAPLIHGDNVIAIHGRENLDTSTIGRMLCLPLGDGQGAGAVLPPSVEIWRNDLSTFSSSPVLVGDRVYQTVHTGELCAVDATSGEVLWHEKLATDQIHASPVYADGKLYVPMNNGSFHVVRPNDEGPERLSQTQLEGSCLGAPAIAGGRIYVHSTERLYCFGTPGAELGSSGAGRARLVPGEPGALARLQVVPAEILLRPGEAVPLAVRGLDAQGRARTEAPAVEWNTAGLDVTVDVEGVLRVADDAQPGVGVVTASADGLSAGSRVRIVPHLPSTYDFEGAELGPHPEAEGVAFAHPPGHWIGARKKWEVREVDGQKVLAKTLDVTLFQRSFSLFGTADMSNYTLQADIMSDGNRRTMSTAGLLNQRYLIQLKGNHQSIEISSNDERLKVKAPFSWKRGVWYTLKTRVDLADDGSAVVRAKAWVRGEAEPEAWTLEVPHAQAHTSGTPGLFGFAPQSRFHVYVDNLIVTPNE